jgi:hypothetical protein
MRVREHTRSTNGAKPEPAKHGQASRFQEGLSLAEHDSVR